MSNPIRSGTIRASVVLSTLGLLLSGCGHPAADPRTEAPLVRVATAGTGQGQAHRYTGIVASRIQSDLGFRIAGKVVARLVDTGQTVRRGQPLMRIDATDYILASRTQAGTVAAARATALQTAADEKRYRELVGAGAVSASAYDKARAAADAAHAQLAAVQAQASVATNATGYTLLRADADGTVVETLAEPGQVVAAGQAVVRLAHTGAREAIVSLPETERPRIGSTARAQPFDGAVASIARLRQLSDAADPQTRTYEARYVLNGAAASAPLGSTVTVMLDDGRAATASLQVPLGALYDAGKGPGVWVVAGDDKARWRPVAVVGLGAESVTITSGLQPGERFVALGAHLLHEGQAVRPINAVAAR